MKTPPRSQPFSLNIPRPLSLSHFSASKIGSNGALPALHLDSDVQTGTMTQDAGADTNRNIRGWDTLTRNPKLRSGPDITRNPTK
jgi:hypothetical protein